jgi:hypothetical protein
MVRTRNPDIIQERILRLRAELRRLKAELRLADADRRDRERLERQSRGAPSEASA